MKIVNIKGGLGNQMFQYAFAYVCKLKHPKEEVYIDVQHFSHYGLHNGFELNEVFEGLKISIAPKEIIKRIALYLPHYKWYRILRKLRFKKQTEYLEKQDFTYDAEALYINGDCYYDGYWQAYQYFTDYRKMLQAEFKFKKINEQSLMLARNIDNEESVGLHVRKGDYTDKGWGGICTIEYYTKAVTQILVQTKNPVFYIFSNDLNWCKQNILPLLDGRQCVLVDFNKGKESFCDMYLMAHCRYLVIANSTFSWWGAFLNQNAKQIIAPYPWNNSGIDAQIYGDDWSRIKMK